MSRRRLRYTVPTDAPEGDGTLTWDATTIVLVEARGGGTTGTGWTYGPPAARVVATTLAASSAAGSRWTSAAAFDRDGASGAQREPRGRGRLRVSAVDMALWDLKARLLGLPLHRLLGAVRTEVPVYGSGGFTTYDDGAAARQLQAGDAADPPRQDQDRRVVGHRGARDLAGSRRPAT